MYLLAAILYRKKFKLQTRHQGFYEKKAAKVTKLDKLLQGSMLQHLLGDLDQKQAFFENPSLKRK